MGTNSCVPVGTELDKIAFLLPHIVPLEKISRMIVGAIFGIRPAAIWLLWVHAGTQAHVEEGFRVIADVVKLAGRNQPKIDIPQLVDSWPSSERNGRWVTILDCADDRNVFYGVSGNTHDERPLAT